jgi:ABC-type Mn2+/Zn2+ transport system permease subunit
VVSWLFLSYFLWTSSGATIVLILILCFLVSLIWKKI